MTATPLTLCTLQSTESVWWAYQHDDPHSSSDTGFVNNNLGIILKMNRVNKLPIVNLNPIHMENWHNIQLQLDSGLNVVPVMILTYSLLVGLL